MINLPPEGLFVGRVWRKGLGPSLVTLRAGQVFDITSRAAPTMRDLMEVPDIPAFVASQAGEDIGSLDDLAVMSVEAGPDATRLLAPCDLQAVKACGVTFAGSRVERVIEERARGSADAANAMRAMQAGPKRSAHGLPLPSVTVCGGWSPALKRRPR